MIRFGQSGESGLRTYWIVHCGGDIVQRLRTSAARDGLGCSVEDMIDVTVVLNVCRKTARCLIIHIHQAVHFHFIFYVKGKGENPRFHAIKAYTVTGLYFHDLRNIKV